MSSFASRLIAWQAVHGRNDLPWQNTRDAYRIWLSEIMLQQTQVSTVIPYYLRFLENFPDVASLAAAPQERVLELWAGLGYYTRARNLHGAARKLVAEHGGVFPADPAIVAELPGIGRSTAAAICAFAYGTRSAILDGNVKRVLARHRGVEGFPGAPKVEKQLWAEAEALLPDSGIERYTQALMDLGATLCGRANPACLLCPVNEDCIARRDGRTDELPTPRPAKTLPERTATWLLLRDGKSVLVERRPDTGIWGGLLSLPELPAEVSDPADYCRRQFGLQVSGSARLPEVVHVFTHFRLRASPLTLEVQGIERRAGEPGRLWVALDAVEDLAFPAPVKRLLQRVTVAG